MRHSNRSTATEMPTQPGVCAQTALQKASKGGIEEVVVEVLVCELTELDVDVDDLLVEVVDVDDLLVEDVTLGSNVASVFGVWPISVVVPVASVAVVWPTNAVVEVVSSVCMVVVVV